MDPTLRLTFADFQIRVAEYLGIAPYTLGVAAVPTDAHDLDLVGRLVNDGYRRFITDYDRWNFLNVPLSLSLVAQSTGSVTASTGTTFTVGALAGTFADDYFNGWEVTLIDAPTGTETVVTITDYTGSSGVFTAASVPASIGSGDTVQYAGPSNPAGQAWRYYMPDDFYGLMVAPFTNGITGPGSRIAEATEVEIREARASSVATGDPTHIAFRPVNTTASSSSKRWEAILHPAPSSARVITGRYKRFPNKLTSASDTSVAGFQHDSTVLAAALAGAELHRNDAVGIHEQTYGFRLLTSKRIDARSNPARNKPYGDGGEYRPRKDARVSTYNNEPLT